MEKVKVKWRANIWTLTVEVLGIELISCSERVSQAWIGLKDMYKSYTADSTYHVLAGDLGVIPTLSGPDRIDSKWAQDQGYQNDVPGEDVPLFSTTDPGRMGMDGSEVHHLDLKEERSVYQSEKPKGVAMYLDGIMADEMGYDIPYLLSGHVTGEDHQKCLCITPAGKYVVGFINKSYVGPEGSISWGEDQLYDLFYIQTTENG